MHTPCSMMFPSALTSPPCVPMRKIMRPVVEGGEASESKPQSLCICFGLHADSLRFTPCPQVAGDVIILEEAACKACLSSNHLSTTPALTTTLFESRRLRPW